MTRHNPKSTGGIQRGLNVLTGEDLVERHPVGESWHVIDPILRQWPVERAL